MKLLAMFGGGAVAALGAAVALAAGGTGAGASTTTASTTTATTTAPTSTLEARADVSGPCDEAEHRADPRCAGTAASTGRRAERGDDDGRGRSRKGRGGSRRGSNKGQR